VTTFGPSLRYPWKFNSSPVLIRHPPPFLRTTQWRAEGFIDSFYLNFVSKSQLLLSSQKLPNLLTLSKINYIGKTLYAELLLVNKSSFFNSKSDFLRQLCLWGKGAMRLTFKPMWSTNLWDKARPQHRELRALLFTILKSLVSLTSPTNHLLYGSYVLYLVHTKVKFCLITGGET